MIMNEQEFKVGDEVEVLDDYDSCKKGDILTIDEIDKDGDLWFRPKDFDIVDGFSRFWLRPTDVKLVSPKVHEAVHPHHDIIIAWLNGEDIQAREYRYMRWEDVWKVNSSKTDTPFMEGYEYRIKPKQSEQELEIQRLEKIINDAKDSIEKLKEMK